MRKHTEMLARTHLGELAKEVMTRTKGLLTLSAVHH